MQSWKALTIIVAAVVGLGGEVQAIDRTRPLRSAAPELASPSNPSRLPPTAERPVSVNVLEPPRIDGLGSGAQYSLAQLQEMALAQNPTIGQAAARVDAARGRVDQARLWPNPTAGYMGSEIGNEGTAGQQGGYVSQKIILGKKLRLSEEAAYQNLLVVGQEYEAQRLRVLTEVKIRFYEALIAQNMRELAGELVRIGDQGIETAQALIKVGEAARVDLIQAELVAQQARIQFDNAANRHTAAWRELAAVVGLQHLEPAVLAGDVDQAAPRMDWRETLQQIYAGSPQLVAARAAIEQARWAYQRALAEPIPDVTAQAAVQKDDGTGDTFASIQIGAPLPLFNRNQGTIRQRRAEIAAAEIEVARLELWLQRRLAGAYEKYDNARRQVARYREEMLPRSRESLELISEGFAAGELNYRDLLIAQRLFFETNLDYLRALESLRVSGAEIEGLLLTDGLQAPSS